MKIGIISFAHLHAEAYAAILADRRDIDFIGIWDDNLHRGQNAAGRFQVPFFNNLDNFFSARPDAVILCPENSRHRELAALAAEADCAVLCEKPLATSVEDAGFMVNLFRQKQLLLMTAFPMRYSPPVQSAWEAVRTGKLGEVYSICSVNQGQLPMDGHNWFVDRELAGGGAITDHLVHLCDLFHWILDKEVSEVYARSNRKLHQEKNIQVETGALVMLQFRNGPFASIDCSWSRPAGYPTWGGLSFTIIAEKGNMKVDAFRQTMALHFHRERSRLDYWGSDTNALMIDDFIRCFREKRSPRVSGEDGLKTVQVVSAAYRSATEGEPTPN